MAATHMKVIQSVSGLMSATKGQDLNIFIEGLTGIQEGFSGASNVMEATMMAYDKVTTLAQSRQGFMISIESAIGTRYYEMRTP